MKNILEKEWALKVISLVFALFIFSFVSRENNVRNAAINTQLASSVNSTETINNVPLYLGPHPDDIFVSDLQEKVSVKLSGPKNILNQVTRETLNVQTQEITHQLLGVQELTLMVKGLPEELSYEIAPAHVQVEVQQRAVATMPVEVKLDDLHLADDVKVAKVEIEPREVKLVGSKKAIDSIDFVGINVTSETEKEQTFDATYRLQILDKDGKLLDASSETMDIKAQVILVQNSIHVPLTITAIGEDNKAFSYKYSFVDQDMVELFGKQDLLDKIKEVELVVDVSELEKSERIDGMLNLPSGISSASTNKVRVQVDIEPLEIETTQK